MKLQTRTAAVWGVLALGLYLVLTRIPMPGVGGAPPPPPETQGIPLPPEATEIQAAGADEAFARGLADLGAGRLEEALTAFDRVLALDPTQASVRVQKAFVVARKEGGDPAQVRTLLAEASARGFDRAKALENEAKALVRAAGDPRSQARFHLERAVLLGFGEPADLPGAREELVQARGLGIPASRETEVALGAAQVPAPPGR